MPCRDAAADLPAAMASLEAQTLGDFEVLATDERSSDVTRDRLLAWAERDGRVRVLTARAPGRVGALSALLAAARAELVARMDPHHVADPRRFQEQCALLDADPRIAMCGVRVRFATAPSGSVPRRHFHWLNGPVAADAIARELFVYPPVAPASVLVRRSVLLGVGGYRDMGWPEDYDLQLRLWAAGYRMASTSRVLLNARPGSPGYAAVEPGYDGGALRRCKIHFLRRTLLAARAGAVIWGTGPVARAFGRELLRHAIPVRGFIDARPPRRSRRIQDAPVLPPSRLESLRDALLLLAVGVAAVRDEIRAALTARGARELEDFVAVA
jgi:glycosyltransferase involved in cell wall biosynthesis